MHFLYQWKYKMLCTCGIYTYTSSQCGTPQISIYLVKTSYLSLILIMLPSTGHCIPSTLLTWVCLSQSSYSGPMRFSSMAQLLPLSNRKGSYHSPFHMPKLLFTISANHAPLSDLSIGYSLGAHTTNKKKMKTS